MKPAGWYNFTEYPSPNISMICPVVLAQFVTLEALSSRWSTTVGLQYPLYWLVRSGPAFPCYQEKFLHYQTNKLLI